jgi:hypothetical protein
MSLLVTLGLNHCNDKGSVDITLGWFTLIPLLAGKDNDVKKEQRTGTLCLSHAEL